MTPPAWFAHLDWTTTTPAAPDYADTLTAITRGIAGYGDSPSTPGYVLAPDQAGTWRIGIPVEADTIGAAASGAEWMLTAATLHAGQTDVTVTRLEVVPDDGRDHVTPALLRHRAS